MDSQINDLNLIIDVVNRRAIRDTLSNVEITLPPVVQGDRYRLVVIAVKPAARPSQTKIWDFVQLPASLFVGIGDIGEKPTQGTFTLTFGADETAPLAYNAAASAVQTALNNLASITAAGGVLVSGEAGGPYQVTFNNAGARDLIVADSDALYPLSGINIYASRDGTVDLAEIQLINLEVQMAALAQTFADIPAASVAIEVLQGGAADVPEIQRVTISADAYEGTFTLTFDGKTTAPIRFDALPEEVEEALEALSNIGAGNVAVSGSTPQWTVAFQGTLTGNQPSMTGSAAGLVVPIGKVGTLDLSTGGIEQLVAGAESAATTLEVSALYAGTDPATILQMDITVLNDGIPSAPSSGNVLPEYLTAAGGDARFLRIDEPQTLDAGEQLALRTAIGAADQTAIDAKAPLASPILTGTPTAPTAAAGTNTTQLATTAFVKTALDNVIDTAPGALDTLNEIAAALGDDANYAATMTAALAAKSPINNANLTGTTTIAALTLGATPVTATGAELNHCDGVISNIQTQLDAKKTPQTTIYTANDTWTKPAGAVRVEVLLLGAGGGGGSGRRGAAASNRYGGAGGNAGALVRQVFNAADLGATAAVVVGAAGAGGAAQTVDSTNGNSGTTGGFSSFAGMVKAIGGQGGGGGTTTAGAAAAVTGNASGGPNDFSLSNAQGGAGGTSNGSDGATVSNSLTCTGGGGGGGITSANVAGVGGGGGSLTGNFLVAGISGGTPGGSTGAAGSIGIITKLFAGTGGGGGAGGDTAGTTAGGAGGAGANYGGGGGGGGGSTNGANSGAGGAGAAGLVIVTTYF